MTVRAVVGAVAGLWMALATIFVLILWPRLDDGDFYEVGDPLVYLGLPVLLVLLIAGALVGLASGISVRCRGVSARTQTLVMATGLVGIALLVGLYAWGVG